MREMDLSGSTGASKIRIGCSFEEVKNFCDPKRAIFIVDEKVLSLYGERLSPYRCLSVEATESCKTLNTVDRLYGELLDLEADRSTMIVGLGGGITCDVAGFAAATYMRGLPFGFVPTTLLALVDASVGGKNGVNYRGYKNLVGTFKQPEFVLADFSFLTTLPYDEMKNGIAEIVKHGLIANKTLFEDLEKNPELFSAIDAESLEKIVYESLAVKIDIVSRDETEKGERRKLNFGHTVAHAIEKTTGQIHGEAVAIGMVLAARLSKARGGITANELARIEKVIDGFRLPTLLSGGGDKVLEAITKDKKREGDAIHFVLLEGIGKAVIESIPIDELREALRDLC